MRLKRKKRLYILADSEDLSNIYYIENGSVKKQPIRSFDNTANSPFLLHNPIGWQEEEISFATSDKYKSLNRSFNLGLTFVYDGAQIIRTRQYFGLGSEEVMYMAILRWNRSDDKYYLEYKGKLDLSSTEDDINGGIKVNSVEGGVLSYLTANAGTTYEIPCDESNENIKTVLLDGMNLKETLNYTTLEVQVDGDFYIVPFQFVSNEGDHEDVLYGSPFLERSGNSTDYYKESQNYLLKNTGENAVTFHIKLPLSISRIDTDDQPGLFRLFTKVATDEAYVPSGFTTIYSHAIPSSAIEDLIEFDFTLQPGEKLFIDQWNFFSAPGVVGGLVYYNKSDFTISFTSRKAKSTAFCMLLYDYYKLMVSKMTDGKYSGESEYLKSRKDLTITCGDALRNTDRSVIPNYMIAATFDDMFQSIPGSLPEGSSVGLQVRNGVLYLELLSDLYGDESEIYPLDNVSGLKIKVATDVICNTILNGYPDQQYDTNGGKLEVNSEQEWQLPVISVSKPLNIRSVFRADPRGIEKIRNKYTKLDTTDNSGDKEPFLIQVNEQSIQQTYIAQRVNDKSYTGQSWIDYDSHGTTNFATMQLNSDGYTSQFTGSFNKADIVFAIDIDNPNHHTYQILVFKNGHSIAVSVNSNQNTILTIPGVQLLHDDIIQAQVVPFDDDGLDFTVTNAILNITFLIRPLTLYRPEYTSIEGVLDSSVYNVELRPRNQIFWNGNEIHGILAQQPSAEIKFGTAAKNAELKTEIGGIINYEKDPISVSQLAPPLWLPYNFEFTTEVPYTFTDLLAMSTTGYFSFIYNGVEMYGLPIGSMVSKPADGGAQTWTLRAAAKNTWLNFFNSSKNDLINFTFDSNMIATSIYNPVHLIKYGFTPQAKYHHIDMREDWSYHRFNDWFVHGEDAFYSQKWQLSDTVKCPIISSGLGNLSWVIYDAQGKEYLSGLFNVITTNYVRSPYSLQEADIPLNAFDEGLYIFVVKTGANPVWISEWWDIKANHPETFIFTYSHSKNELNVPWLAYNGYLEFRCEALFEQWEPDSLATYYADDYGDFTVLNDLPLMKRNLMIGGKKRVPEWVGLKVNAILLKDRVFIEGNVNDETKHYTRREGSAMETVKLAGMPYLSYNIEVVPATNSMFTVESDIPFEEVNGWHATIGAEVFGSDYGDEEITIKNE